jgi:hypothetical protein
MRERRVELMLDINDGYPLSIARGAVDYLATQHSSHRSGWKIVMKSKESFFDSFPRPPCFEEGMGRLILC